jgi:hypothetical protein
MPLDCSAAFAASAWPATKSDWRTESGTAADFGGIATGFGAAAPSPTVCRSSWRAIASARPPGRPLILTASCWSSISVPSFVPSLSSMPDDAVASRMLFRSCCMNSDSNCFAVSRIAAFGSRAAVARSASTEDVDEEGTIVVMVR